MSACLFLHACSDTPQGSKSKSTSEKPVIGFSLGTLREERWIRDRDEFVKNAEALGAAVNVLFANNDADLQISQTENLILQGVAVLVVVPHDGKAAAAIVTRAHAAGIKVLAYDRIISDSDLDFYVSFDSEKVGALQAQGILEKVNTGCIAYIGGSEKDYNAFLLKKGSIQVLAPLIQQGTIRLCLDVFSPDWKPEAAYENLKGYLLKGNTIDAVVCANDGTAFGAILALKEFGRAGKVPVSGQDAELSACRRIIASRREKNRSTYHRALRFRIGSGCKRKLCRYLFQNRFPTVDQSQKSRRHRVQFQTGRRGSIQSNAPTLQRKRLYRKSIVQPAAGIETHAT